MLNPLSPIAWYKPEAALLLHGEPARLHAECPYGCRWQVEGERGWVESMAARHDCAATAWRSLTA